MLPWYEVPESSSYISPFQPTGVLFVVDFYRQGNICPKLIGSLLHVKDVFHALLRASRAVYHQRRVVLIKLRTDFTDLVLRI